MEFRIVTRVAGLPLLILGAVAVFGTQTRSQCDLRWSSVSATGRWVEALLPLANGGVIVGGDLTGLGGAAVSNLALLSGGTATNFAGGCNGAVFAILRRSNGDIVVGGGFGMVGSVPANSIASWNGTSWTALGSGVSNTVYALAELPDGDLVAGGWFATAGGVVVNNIARWNGTSWRPMGAGMNDAVRCLEVMPNGDLIAGGMFQMAGGASCIARWNGAGWSGLGGGVSYSQNASVLGLLGLANGGLLVAGVFTQAGTVPVNSCALWNGTAWSSVGVPHGGFRPALQLPGGDVVAGSWDGVWRWNGTIWRRLAQGSSPLPTVGTLAVTADGDLLAGGVENSGAFLFSFGPTCRAGAAAYGTACTGSAGPATLTASTLPWLGSTFRASAAGLPVRSLSVAVTGFARIAVPLSTWLPRGVPGCDLLVAADVLEPRPVVGGISVSELSIPNNVSLAGQVFHHQMVPVELDAGGIPVAFTSTNALTLTMGAL